MNKFGLGIIGLGVIGERLMPVFLEHPGIEVVSVTDTDQDRMDYMEDKFGVTSVLDYKEMLSDDRIQMIYLAVPPKYHHDIAIDIMRAGKHILCEKPLAGTIEEAEKMSEIAKETQVVHAMNFPLYYGFAYNKIKSMLKNDVLGRIKALEIKGVFPTWPRSWQQNNWIDTRQEGGFTREIFTHYVQLIQSSFGLIQDLESRASYPNQDKSEATLIGMGHIDDISVLFYGMTGIGQEEDLRFTLYGDKGKVELINWRQVIYTNLEGSQIIEPEPVNATYDLIHAFYQAVRGQESDLVSFEDGLNATKVVEKLLKA